MKRFLLFCGDQYYPAGGWNDFYCDFATAEAAFFLADKMKPGWFHVVDTETMKAQIIENGEQL